MIFRTLTVTCDGELDHSYRPLGCPKKITVRGETATDARLHASALREGWVFVGGVFHFCPAHSDDAENSGWYQESPAAVMRTRMQVTETLTEPYGRKWETSC